MFKFGNLIHFSNQNIFLIKDLIQDLTWSFFNLNIFLLRIKVKYMPQSLDI